MSPAKKAEHAKTLEKFEKRAGVSFKNIDILKTAFTHRSYLNEVRVGEREHNERLEFLGDAVLELIVTDHLFRQFPRAKEGDLTGYRAALVNAVMLAEIAEELGMNECLLLSKGESKDTGRARANILANTFEAVTGAIFMDRGYTAAEKFIAAHVLPRIAEVLKKELWRDAKSAFQELAQDKYGITPKYKTVKAEGPDHDKHFVVEVWVGEVALATGEGKSKQEAEQSAAHRALTEAK